MKKNVASQTVVLSLFSGADRVANPTIALGDVKVDLDGAGQGNVNATPTSDAAGLVTWLPTAGETNADVVTLLFNDAAGAEWDAVTLVFYTEMPTSIAAIEADTGTDGVVLANDAITLAKFDETTAWPLVASDTGATQVARVGADSDTLETLSDQIDGVEPADVWAYATRTLTQSAASVAAAVAGSAISVTRNTYWSASLTGLTTGVDISEAILSVKTSAGDTDTNSILRISSVDGLEIVDGDALADLTTLVAGDGVLTVDGDAGTATIVLKTIAASMIDPGVYSYDLRYIDSSDEEHAWSAPANWTVANIITRAV